MMGPGSAPVARMPTGRVAQQERESRRPVSICIRRTPSSVVKRRWISSFSWFFLFLKLDRFSRYSLRSRGDMVSVPAAFLSRLLPFCFRENLRGLIP